MRFCAATLLLLLLGEAFVARAADVTNFTTSGRVIELASTNAHLPSAPTVFQMRGFSYSNFRIGEGPNGGTDGPFGRDALSQVDICAQDFPLMRGYNVNAIKIYDFNVVGVGIAAKHKKCLDLLWNDGVKPIFVVLSVYIATLPFANEQARSNMTDRYTDMVVDTRDHPAVMGYSVGSEIGGDPNGNVQYWKDFNVIAHAIHAALGGRKKIVTTGTYQAPCTICNPVVPCIGHIINGEKYGAAVDVWGVDIYSPNPQDPTLRKNIHHATTKPFFFPEYGVNYEPPQNVMTQTKTLLEQIGGVIQFSFTEATHHENQGHGAYNSSAPVYSGGLVFEWEDEYWKGGGSLCVANNASAQPFYGVNAVALRSGCVCPGSLEGSCATDRRVPRPILAEPSMLPSLWSKYTP